ncbi:hypothetical protein ACFL4T_10910 [candidate division KSB1 bacterium]
MKVSKTPFTLFVLIILSFSLMLVIGCGKEEGPLDTVIMNEAGEYDQAKVTATTTILQAIDSYNSAYPSSPIDPASYFSGVNQSTLKGLKDRGINNFNAVSGVIDNLKSEVEDAKALAPKFVMVSKGDTEKGLRMKILTEEIGLSSEEAAGLVKGLQMCKNLQAGWKMWYVYNPDTKEFATAYTKGDADVSPVGAQMAMMKNMEVEYGNKFVPYLNRISGLETEIENVKSDVEGIKENIEKTKSYYAENIENINAEFTKDKNTMKYVAGSEIDLKAKMVIKKDALIGYDFSMVKEFDIREGTLELPFSTAGYKEVTVLPAIFNASDFSITQSGGKYIFKINPGREAKFLQNVVVFTAK